eukprot:2175842-Rhodomonas_salina.2
MTSCLLQAPRPPMRPTDASHWHARQSRCYDQPEGGTDRSLSRCPGSEPWYQRLSSGARSTNVSHRNHKHSTPRRLLNERRAYFRTTQAPTLDQQFEAVTRTASSLRSLPTPWGWRRHSSWTAKTRTSAACPNRQTISIPRQFWELLVSPHSTPDTQETVQDVTKGC